MIIIAMVVISNNICVESNQLKESSKLYKNFNK